MKTPAASYDDDTLAARCGHPKRSFLPPGLRASRMTPAAGGRFRRSLRSGQSIVEFMMVVPALTLLFFAVIESGLVGTRSIISQFAALRAARVEGVYQADHVQDELNAHLPRILYKKGGVVEAPADAPRMTIRTRSQEWFPLTHLKPASLMERSSPRVPALSGYFTTAILRGGDSPSPYCGNKGDYTACGYSNP